MNSKLREFQKCAEDIANKLNKHFIFVNISNNMLAAIQCNTMVMVAVTDTTDDWYVYIDSPNEPAPIGNCMNDALIEFFLVFCRQVIATEVSIAFKQMCSDCRICAHNACGVCCEQVVGAEVGCVYRSLENPVIMEVIREHIF